MNIGRRAFLVSGATIISSLALGGEVAAYDNTVNSQTYTVTRPSGLIKQYDPDEQVGLLRLSPDGTLEDVTSKIITPLSEGLPAGRGIVKKLARFNVGDSYFPDHVLGLVEDPERNIIWRMLKPSSSEIYFGVQNADQFLQDMAGFKPFGERYLRLVVDRPDRPSNLGIFEKIVGSDLRYFAVDLDTGASYGDQTKWVKDNIGDARQFYGMTIYHNDNNNGQRPVHDEFLTKGPNGWKLLQRGTQGTLEYILEQGLNIRAENVSPMKNRIKQVVPMWLAGRRKDEIYFLVTNRNYGGVGLVAGSNSPVTIYEGDSVTFSVVYSGPYPFNIQWRSRGEIDPWGNLTGRSIIVEPSITIRFQRRGTYKDNRAVIRPLSELDEAVIVEFPEVNVVPQPNGSGQPSGGGSPPGGGPPLPCPPFCG